MIVAQAAGYSLVHLLILIIIVGACVGIAMIALRQSGIAVPAWVIQILTIVAVCVVAILAIRFVAGL